MFSHSATPISCERPALPGARLAENNSTLKADTFLFLVKSHLKKHKGLIDQRALIQPFPFARQFSPELS
jgi:hypothetical protein